MNADPASPTPDPMEEAIFHAASDLGEPLARAAFLDRACGADSALRSRIELLLAADLRARQFLAEDPLDLDSKTIPKPVVTPPEQSSGDQIGRYKLLEKIGEGGMGVVYMAEQREPVVRKVALKIIKPGMDTRQVVARFEAERQALALMDHPNIARVLDGGVTDDSRPYFVMDLVQGVPITQFCDERNLSTRARLDLFLEVCSAIQHAHQK
jgi:eukaryotic-like serine/threonine-protein kinase